MLHQSSECDGRKTQERHATTNTLPQHGPAIVTIAITKAALLGINRNPDGASLRPD
jgi:hypothetical protein